MTSALFLAFTVLVATSIVFIVLWRSRDQAVPVALILLGWLAYVGTLSWSGVIADPTVRPQPITFVVGPVILFIVFGVMRSAWAGRIASAIPLWVLIAFQSYRVGVELFLHQLWLEKLVPKMLTFEGANIDILVGASAAAAGWLSTRGRLGLRIALVWNALGLLVLANVVVRSALTAPGPLHLLQADLLNRAVGTFPYTYIAGFFAPLAVVLHGLALRSIARHLRHDVTIDAPPAASPSREIQR